MLHQMEIEFVPSAAEKKIDILHADETHSVIDVLIAE